jgi:hypothetical protein
MSDERPKKSWREIDKAREQSSQRRENPTRESARSLGAQRQYRATLDRLFDSGEATRLLGKKVEPPAQNSRLGAIRAVKEAIGKSEISSAVDALLAFGSLPEDEEVLTQAIDHRDESKVRLAMETLQQWLDKNQPRRKGTLRARLEGLRQLAEEEETKLLASALLERL